MGNIDKKILKFIHSHHVLTLATVSDNKPYCASCFYVYREKENAFIFTSDKDTKHIKDVAFQDNIAGAIALETTMVGKIRGVQFTGFIEEILPGTSFYKIAKSTYIKRFPVAALAKLTLWKASVHFFKYTDNRLGFGKKIIWNKDNNGI